jgi:hypothetical protein
MAKYINTLLLLIGSVSSFIALQLLQTAAMLDQWLMGYLTQQYASGFFPQTRIEAPIFDDSQLEVAKQVFEFNFNLSQSIPIYFNFTSGGYIFIFLGLSVVFGLAFFYSLYTNIKDLCKK